MQYTKNNINGMVSLDSVAKYIKSKTPGQRNERYDQTKSNDNSAKTLQQYQN